VLASTVAVEEDVRTEGIKALNTGTWMLAHGLSELVGLFKEASMRE
jgi:hypothetical protein